MSRVSIVTACRNAASTVDRTIASVLAQSHQNTQYIIVDGASTDGTVEAIERYAARIDSFVSEPDSGVCDALNKGFTSADGEIFCYLNADDTLHPDAVARVVELFDQHPEVDVVTGACCRVFEDGSQFVTHVPEHFRSTMALRNSIEQPSTFWRSAAHRRAGPFDEHLRLAFDWEYWNRLQSVGAKFLAVDDVLSTYYFSADNLTSKAGLSVVPEMFAITALYASRRVAMAYQIIFDWLDMRGLLDGRRLTWPEGVWVASVLGLLKVLVGRHEVEMYNWHWASMQARGLVWYK